MSLLLNIHYVFAPAGIGSQMTRQELNFLATQPDSLVVGSVSVWEMHLKWNRLHAPGDRKGPLDPAQALRAMAGQDIDFLPLSSIHAATPLRGPFAHIDRFDLLLVQAQAEGIEPIGQPLAMRAT